MKTKRIFVECVLDAGAIGNLVFDAQIVALCREYGVKEIWSNDRDFARFSGLLAQRV